MKTEYNWAEILSKKSNKALYTILTSHSHYTTQVRKTARNELQKRNFDFEQIEATKEKWRREKFIQHENSSYNKFYDSRYYLGASFTFLLITILMLGLHLSKNKPQHKGDLTEVTGILNDYSFEKKRGLKGFVQVYYIWLQNIETPFQIGADYIGQDNGSNFREDQFRQEIRKGDQIKLKVYSDQFAHIHEIDRILIYEIKSNNGIYLQKEHTLKGENESTELYLAIFSFIISLMFGIWSSRKKNRELKNKAMIEL